MTRAAPVSQWKGLAAADTGARAVQAALLAARGIGGPRGIIEGPKGFDEALGKHLEADWTDRSLAHAGRSVIKRHNAEVHSQTTIEATLRLRPRIRDVTDIERVHVAVFRTAYDIIGGGAFGAKEVPATKEDADHNLRYLVATALLDGEVSPRQFLPAALARPEVHALLQRVTVNHDRSKTLRYPECMPAQVTLHLRNGLQYTEKQEDYMELTYPAWETVERKFRVLSDGRAHPDLLDEIVNAIRDLPSLRVVQLTEILGRIRPLSEGR